MIRPGVLRQLLNEDRPSLCVRVNSIWPDIVEMVGGMGAVRLYRVRLRVRSL